MNPNRLCTLYVVAAVFALTACGGGGCGANLRYRRADRDHRHSAAIPNAGGK